MSAGRGFFLVLEGPEGAGKSTLARALVARMSAAGLDPVAVREPGGTPAAEQVRAALLDRANTFGPAAELLFMVAARAHLVQDVIRPALQAGRTVVADRFALSTEAYQGAGRGLDAATIRTVNEVATGGLVPDLTLVIDLDPAVGQARQIAAGKDQDRLDRESPEFHARVAAYYRAAGGPGVRHLDGTADPETLLRAAVAELAKARPEPFGELAG